MLLLVMAEDRGSHMYVQGLVNASGSEGGRPAFCCCTQRPAGVLLLLLAAISSPSPVSLGTPLKCWTNKTLFYLLLFASTSSSNRVFIARALKASRASLFAFFPCLPSSQPSACYHEHTQGERERESKTTQEQLRVERPRVPLFYKLNIAVGREASFRFPLSWNSLSALLSIYM